MDNLNNIVKKSLIKFPIPDKSRFISDIEMLDYFGNLLLNRDAHLGIDFYPKDESLPIARYNSNGYCYIYLNGLNIENRDKYTNMYKKILLRAKKNRCRKFVISVYGRLMAQSKDPMYEKEVDILTHMLSPFYPEKKVYAFPITKKNMVKEDADVELKYFRNKLTTFFKATNITYTSTYDFDFKIPYDSLIFRTSTINKSAFIPFYTDPKVKIFYDITCNYKFDQNLVLLFKIRIKDDLAISTRVLYIQKTFEEKKYKIFKGQDIPAKYLPNT